MTFQQEEVHRDPQAVMPEIPPHHKTLMGIFLKAACYPILCINIVIIMIPVLPSLYFDSFFSITYYPTVSIFVLKVFPTFYMSLHVLLLG